MDEGGPDPHERVCGDECERRFGLIRSLFGSGRYEKEDQEEACSAAEIEVRLKASFCQDCKRDTSKKCQKYKANGYT